MLGDGGADQIKVKSSLKNLDPKPDTIWPIFSNYYIRQTPTKCDFPGIYLKALNEYMERKFIDLIYLGHFLFFSFYESWECYEWENTISWS